MLAVLGLTIRTDGLGPISLSVCVGAGCEPTKTSSVKATSTCTPAADQVVQTPGFAQNLAGYKLTEAGTGRATVLFDTGVIMESDGNTKAL